eukprot:COSAG05_NODE_2790_length_2635_cov_6.935726_2_plen_172_part_00
MPNYHPQGIDRSIATQRRPNPLDIFIATQSLPNEILLSQTIDNILGQSTGTGSTEPCMCAHKLPVQLLYIYILQAVPTVYRTGVPVPRYRYRYSIRTTSTVPWTSNSKHQPCMTRIYLYFRCLHYRLSGNAPVVSCTPGPVLVGYKLVPARQERRFRFSQRVPTGASERFQ